MLYQRRVRTLVAQRVNANDWDGCCAIAHWCAGEVVDLDDYLANPDLGVIWLPGPHALGDFAHDGDWILQTEDGNYIVLVPSVFDALYEPVEGA